MATKIVKVKAEVPEHPLAYLIPDPQIGIDYVSRYISEIKDLTLLKYAHDSHVHVLLFGDTGPGKSMMVRAYCSINRIPLVTVMANGALDPNTFFGGYVPDPETGGIKWQDSEITGIIRYGGCVLIEEINFLVPKSASPFYTALNEGFITIMEAGNLQIPVNDATFFAATYNPDYKGTRPLNEAFKNRFEMKLFIDYDNAVESQLVQMPVLLELAKKLRDSRKAGDLDTPVSTNMLMEFEKFGVDLGLEFATENFIAAFDAGERETVRMVMEMHSTDLRDQMEQLVG